MRRAFLLMIAALPLLSLPAPAQKQIAVTPLSDHPFAQPDAPQVHLTNGVLQVTVYTPDAEKGFYRGTRFDWAGMIGKLEYAGRNYYGPWFSKTDPTVFDFAYRGDDIVAGPTSAAVGPAEEFFTNGKALGFDEAKPGDTFLKIGVGVLRRPDQKDYSSFIEYPLVDGGKRTLDAGKDHIEMKQSVMDAASGYGYEYAKTVRLVAGRPQMIIEHTLKNTGKKTIVSDFFDHNFLSINNIPTGPGLTYTMQKVVVKHLGRSGLGKLDTDAAHSTVSYSRIFTGHDGFSFVTEKTPAKIYDINVENTTAGAALRIHGTLDGEHISLDHYEFWSIRSVSAIEPFVHIELAPGESTHWEYLYTYSSLLK